MHWQPEGRADMGVRVLVCLVEGMVMQCACLGRALRIGADDDRSAVACVQAKPALVTHGNQTSVSAFRDWRKCSMVGTGVSHTFP